MCFGSNNPTYAYQGSTSPPVQRDDMDSFLTCDPLHILDAFHQCICAGPHFAFLHAQTLSYEAEACEKQLV